jgi:methyl-accepting chemotaxis protein
LSSRITVLKTIRSQLIAIITAATLITLLIGAVGLYGVNKLGGELDDAENDGVVMRNHLATDQLHDGLRGLVSIYKLAVAQNNAEQIKETVLEIKVAAKSIREEYAKNLTQTQLDPKLLAEIKRVASHVDSYARNVEDQVNVSTSDTVQLDKLRAEFDKIYLVLEKELIDIRIGIEKKLSDAKALADAIKRQTTYLLVGGALLGTLLLLVINFLFYKRVAAKLEKMTTAMGALSTGDYSARTKLSGNDELSNLGNSFDALLDQRLEGLASQAKEADLISNSVVEIMQAVGQVATNKDLSIQVPVTADVTGAIGDAMNMLTSATAKVLRNVTDVSNDVASASQSVKLGSDTMMTANTASQTEVESAARELSQAAISLNQLSQMAQKANESAELAVRSTRQALLTVDKTVKGINESRDVIRETEKRIKRLGERSQEISQVVSIINSIAERTGLLALNASMQATAAGEAGRGFALVAEEVKRLSENARDATREITTLVSSIQSETSETVLAMNSAITQVVDLSRLADQAGTEMKGTQQATEDLATNVRNIAATSVEQAHAGQTLQARAMTIQQSSREATRQLTAQNDVTNKLVAYAQDLLREVGVFKLPRARS